MRSDSAGTGTDAAHPVEVPVRIGRQHAPAAPDPERACYGNGIKNPRGKASF